MMSMASTSTHSLVSFEEVPSLGVDGSHDITQSLDGAHD